MRFLYVHPLAWYLRLDEGSDTLNFPVDDELAPGGWELRKALPPAPDANAAAATLRQVRGQAGYQQKGGVNGTHGRRGLGVLGGGRKK